MPLGQAALFGLPIVRASNPGPGTQPRLTLSRPDYGQGERHYAIPL